MNVLLLLGLVFLGVPHHLARFSECREVGNNPIGWIGPYSKENFGLHRLEHMASAEREPITEV